MSHFLVQKPIPAKSLIVFVKADNWGPSGFVSREDLAHKFASRARAEKIAARFKGFVVVECAS